MVKTREEQQLEMEQAFNRVMPDFSIIPYVGCYAEVNLEYSLTAMCPVCYPIRDRYTLKITFVPDRDLPELISFMEYLDAFCDIAITHEHLASKIREEFNKKVMPISLDVILETHVKGGLKVTVRC